MSDLTCIMVASAEIEMPFFLQTNAVRYSGKLAAITWGQSARAFLYLESDEGVRTVSGILDPSRIRRNESIPSPDSNFAQCIAVQEFVPSAASFSSVLDFPAP